MDDDGKEDVEERTIQQLTELLEQKNDRIERLRRKVRRLKYQLDFGSWPWPGEVTAEDYGGHLALDLLPVPRFEVLWTPSPEFGWRKTTVDYRLVYQHDSGDLVGVTLTRIKRDGWMSKELVPLDENERVGIPNTMAFEIVHDAKSLGISAVAIAGDNVSIVVSKQPSGMVVYEPYLAFDRSQWKKL